MGEQQEVVCGCGMDSLRRAVEEARQSGTDLVQLDPEMKADMFEIECLERRNQRGLSALAMMASMFGSVYGMSNRHSTPHYFEYSGIPSEEQLRKRAERKARKRALAKKLAK